MNTATENETTADETTAKLAHLIGDRDISDSRKDSLREAIETGTDDATLAKLRDAVRLARRDWIILPAGRFENLSRGRGWCRKGKGDAVTWADREDTAWRLRAAGLSAARMDSRARIPRRGT